MLKTTLLYKYTLQHNEILRQNNYFKKDGGRCY